MNSRSAGLCFAVACASWCVPGTVNACTCPDVSSPDVTFVGRVEAIEKIRNPYPEGVPDVVLRVCFDGVERLSRRVASEQIEARNDICLRTNIESTACGVPFQVGLNYRVEAWWEHSLAADWSGMNLYASKCLNTQELPRLTNRVIAALLFFAVAIGLALWFRVRKRWPLV